MKSSCPAEERAPSAEGEEEEEEGVGVACANQLAMGAQTPSGHGHADGVRA